MSYLLPIRFYITYDRILQIRHFCYFQSILIDFPSGAFHFFIGFNLVLEWRFDLSILCTAKSIISTLKVLLFAMAVRSIDSEAIAVTEEIIVLNGPVV